MKSLSQREYVYKDKLPLYKVKENVNRGKKASGYFRSGGRYLDSCCNVLLSLKSYAFSTLLK